MPTYTFRKGNDSFQLFMSISELDKYLTANPDVVQEISSPSIISGISGRMKPDAGFRDLLKEAKKKNPGGNINDFS